MKNLTGFMKKSLVVFSLLMMGQTIFAALLPTEHSSNLVNQNAKSILIPLNGTNNSISLYDLSRIDRSSLEKLTGKKMNLMERWSFKAAQRKLQKCIREDGFVQNEQLAKKLTRQMYGYGDGDFHIGGFALGLFLGAIGVLIAYAAFNRGDEDLRRRRIKWAWWGWCVWLIAYLILLIAAA